MEPLNKYSLCRFFPALLMAVALALSLVYMDSFQSYVLDYHQAPAPANTEWVFSTPASPGTSEFFSSPNTWFNSFQNCRTSSNSMLDFGVGNREVDFSLCLFHYNRLQKEHWKKNQAYIVSPSFLVRIRPIFTISPLDMEEDFA